LTSIKVQDVLKAACFHHSPFTIYSSPFTIHYSPLAAFKKSTQNLKKSPYFHPMFKTSGRYWFCQFAGWGGWALINLFFAYQFASDIYLHPDTKRNLFFFALFLDLFWSVLLTHLLRMVLKRIHWMKFSFAKVATLFLVATISVTFLEFYAFEASSNMSGLSFEQYINNERKDK